MIKVKVLVSIFGFFLFYGPGAYAVNTANCGSCRGQNASLWTCDGKSCPGYNTIACSCSKGLLSGCNTYYCGQYGGCKARDCTTVNWGVGKTHTCGGWVLCSGSPQNCRYNKNQGLPVCINGQQSYAM